MSGILPALTAEFRASIHAWGSFETSMGSWGGKSADHSARDKKNHPREGQPAICAGGRTGRTGGADGSVGDAVGLLGASPEEAVRGVAAGLVPGAGEGLGLEVGGVVGVRGRGAAEGGGEKEQ